MLIVLKASIFHAFFSALKVKRFQPNFAIFSTLFSPIVKTLQNPNLSRKRCMNILNGATTDVLSRPHFTEAFAIS
jgi:hypothetical protein